jgi:hypothetical protein
VSPEEDLAALGMRSLGCGYLSASGVGLVPYQAGRQVAAVALLYGQPKLNLVLPANRAGVSYRRFGQ